MANAFYTNHVIYEFFMDYGESNFSNRKLKTQQQQLHSDSNNLLQFVLFLVVFEFVLMTRLRLLGLRVCLRIVPQIKNNKIPKQ